MTSFESNLDVVEQSAPGRRVTQSLRIPPPSSLLISPEADKSPEHLESANISCSQGSDEVLKEDKSQIQMANIFQQSKEENLRASVTGQLLSNVEIGVLKSRDNYYRGYGNPEKKCKIVLLSLAVGLVISGSVLIFLVGFRQEKINHNLVIALAVFALAFGVTLIILLVVSGKKINEALDSFTKQLVRDTDELKRNRSRFTHMDDALRLLIFIEIANTVKVLIMQNFEFLRPKAKKYQSLTAYCIKELQIILSVDMKRVLTRILQEPDQEKQLKNVDFIFMVCVPMYFLGAQVLKNGQTVSTIEKGDEEMCRLIHEIMTCDKYLNKIEETIGARNSEARIPLRKVFTNFLLDSSNSTNNDELFHIECLFNTQKVFYSKIQLAMHAQATMKQINGSPTGSPSPLLKKQKVENYLIEKQTRPNSLAKKCDALSAFKIMPVFSMEEGQSQNSPTKRSGIKAQSQIQQQQIPQGDEAAIASVHSDTHRTKKTERSNQLEEEEEVCETPLNPEIVARNQAMDVLFEELKCIFQLRDDNKWDSQINTDKFKQHRCQPQGSDNIFMKISTNLKASLQSVIENVLNFTHRAKWDTVLFDFETFESTKTVTNEDWSYTRLYYCFKSPYGVSDRDFYLQQHVRQDFPEPGMTSIYVNSIPASEEKPVNKKRVRATIHKIGYIIKPIICPKTGDQHCDIFVINSVDINGLVPKWIVNLASKNVTKEWFVDYEKNCVKYDKTFGIQAQLHADNRV